MVKWALSAAVAALLVGSAGRAPAQGLDTPERPLAVRLGILYPTRRDVRNATRDGWFDLGIDYVLGRSADGNEWSGALDYASARHNQYWAFQGIYMWRNGAGSRGFGYGLGAAFYILDPDNGDGKSRFGIPVVVDWDLTERLFLQAKYHWIFSESDAKAYTLQLGYRF